MEVGLEGCLDMLMLCACCLLLCTLNTRMTRKTMDKKRRYGLLCQAIKSLGDTPILNHSISRIYIYIYIYIYIVGLLFSIITELYNFDMLAFSSYNGELPNKTIKLNIIISHMLFDQCMVKCYIFM